MSEKPRTELLYDHFNYILFLEDERDYVLEVVANNSAAYYLVEHRLTDEEIQTYKQRGKKFIDVLANKYRYGKH
jgi:phage gp36-like protein